MAIKEKGNLVFMCIDCIYFLMLVKAELGGSDEDLMGWFFKEISNGNGAYPKYQQNDLKFGIANLVGGEIARKAFDLEKTDF
jgi:hypothetical protein